MQLPGMTDDTDREAPAKPASSAGKPRRKGIHEPPLLGASPAERVAAAKSLVAAVAEYGENLTDIHDVFRCVRGCLYALDKGEVLRVARGLIGVFKETIHQIDKGASHDVSGVQPNQPDEV